MTVLSSKLSLTWVNPGILEGRALSLAMLASEIRCLLQNMIGVGGMAAKKARP